MIRSVLGLFAAGLLAAPATAATLYRHAALFDGTGAPMQADRAVLVEGERIVAVGPDAQVAAAAPKAARVVDLTGKFLLPGLVDTHEHMATPPNRRRAEANLRRDLYGGVTAVRDMADDLRSVAELARESRAAEIPAPDIYYAALMAGPSFFADPRTAAAAQGLPPGKAPWMQAIDEATDIGAAVTLARGTSPTAIKIYANLPGPLVGKIAMEAHRQGLKVWTHSAVFPATPAEVLDAHPDTVSHTCYMAYQVVGVPASYQQKTPIDPAPFAGGANPVMAGLFTRMAAQGVILDATLYVYDEAERHHAGTPGSPAPYCTTALAALLTRQAWKAGVAISTGTDAVAAADDPWPSLYGELDLLAGKVGMSPAQVLHAATQVGARAAGQDADLGLVAPGKLADLIVTDRDPTADLANLKTLRFTVKRGREYPRSGYVPPSADELQGCRPMSDLRRRTLLALAGAAAAAAPALAAGTDPLAKLVVVNALGGLVDANHPEAPPTVVTPRVLADARASGMTAVNWTLGYVAGPQEPFQDSIADIAKVDAEIRRQPHALLKVFTAADILRAKAERKIGVIYGFQNAAQVGGDPARVDIFANLGVRVIQLTYNVANALGDGSMAPEGRGLTPFGRQVVERLNANRVMVDLSHSGRQICLDAARASKQPISINHTGCRALTDLPRNKTDEELRLVAERGGFVGVYFMPFLNLSGHASAEDVVAHIEHAWQVCGEDHVGIGTDGGTTPIDDLEAYKAALAKEHADRVAKGIAAAGERADTHPFVDDLRGPDQFRKLYRLLAARGHRPARLEKLMGGAFLSYAREVWGT